MAYRRSRFVRLAPALSAAVVVSLSGSLVQASDDFDCETCRAYLDAFLSGEEGPRWDPATGEDKANYARDRIVDYRRMRLEIDIPDMNERRFVATQQLEFTPMGDGVRELALDAELLTIDGVESERPNQGVSWSHDGKQLQLVFDPPLQPGETQALKIDYTMSDPVDGMIWTPESEAWPGRAPQIHTQGQPETNRFWFPSHDFPNERLATELIVTVPDGFEVSGNGKLVSKKSSSGRTTFHWQQNADHVNYLVSLVVGQFDIVDVGRGEVDMPVYAPVGKGHQAPQTYGRTLDMLHVFEDRFGVAYPWERYAQLVVWNFGAGGMENTSATTMHDTAILDAKALEDGDMDSLIAHELGHQWYGDLITCNTWAHIWLNEGFASFTESLWYEKRDGYDAGYLNDVYMNMSTVAKRDKLDPNDENAWRRPGMVSRRYEHPWEVFRRLSNPYPKGTSLLHMLRMKLGDEVFFRGLEEYTRLHANGTVETVDFRRAMERASGLSLEAFFEQWAYRPGVPDVNVKASWDQAASELKIVFEQTQRIDEMLPAFRLDLPVLVVTASGEQWVPMTMTQRRHERTIALDGAPEMVIVDPDLRSLKTLTVDQPADRIIAQLERGPTVAARRDAARGLAAHESDSVKSALIDCVLRSTEHFAVRRDAATSLGEMRAKESLISALGVSIEDARVRAAAVKALGECRGDDAASVITSFALNPDESYATRAAAMEAVGKLGGDEALEILKVGLAAESQHDQIRRSALRGLASLDEVECLELALPFVEEGHLSRTRPVAISTVSKLADYDKEAAYDAVAPLLMDHEERTRNAAGPAIVRIEDERGVAELRRIARTDRHPVYREMASKWADELQAALKRGDSGNNLQKEIEELRQELEDVKRLVEEK